MKHLIEKLVEINAEHAKRSTLLALMISTDYENLPQDTLVYCVNQVEDLTRKLNIRYFKCAIKHENRFSVYADGRTSKTTESTSTFPYCLPVEVVDKLSF